MSNAIMVNQKITEEEQLKTSKELTETLEYIQDHLTEAFNKVDLTKINKEFDRLAQLTQTLFTDSYITKKVKDTNKSLKSEFDYAKYWYDDLKDEGIENGLFEDDRSIMINTVQEMCKFLYMYTDRCGVWPVQ
ncbi:hypothetical protein DY037_05605 [Apilactobacillus micheneri]|uniref:hypothetical protein n=1 Tax=Apilactobacillus micheneri TaxID=1899430 RepID=UPI001128A003|nr:hypothetical protein [Apilactobacillus micheneri]TPR49257.1 hypothetical protein DY037_05605 [Apilactobacillus micheneri]